MSKLENIQVLAHSSIRIDVGQVVYFDPFRTNAAPHDADIICITHEHYDHFSPEDIDKLTNGRTVFVAPASIKEKVLTDTGYDEGRWRFLTAGETAEINKIKIEAVPAYNVNKQFHKKEYGWLGYVLDDGKSRYYVAGDTDDNEDVRKVKCDIALLPIGGTYTMDAKEAAGLAKVLKTKAAIPTHFGCIVGAADADREFYRYL